MKQRRHSPEPVKPSVHGQTEIQLYMRQRLRVGWLTLPEVKVYCKHAFKIDWVLISREAAQRSRGSSDSGVIQTWEPVLIRMWVRRVSLGTFGYALDLWLCPWFIYLWKGNGPGNGSLCTLLHRSQHVVKTQKKKKRYFLERLACSTQIPKVGTVSEILLEDVFPLIT